jgi:hypothetical protein
VSGVLRVGPKLANLANLANLAKVAKVVKVANFQVPWKRRVFAVENGWPAMRSK